MCESVGNDSETTREDVFWQDSGYKWEKNINHQRKEDDLEGKIGNNKSTINSLEDQNEKTKQNEMDMGIGKIY